MADSPREPKMPPRPTPPKRAVPLPPVGGGTAAHDDAEPAWPTEPAAEPEAPAPAWTTPPQPLPLPEPPPARERFEPGPPDGPDPKTMTCPYCLSHFDWNRAPLVDRLPDGTEVPLRPEPDENPYRWRNRTVNAWRVCQATGEPHFLPASLGEMTTLIVGVVGKSGAGKSHLVAAMMEELLQTTLLPQNLDVLPLNPQLQQELFEQNRLGLLRDHKVLPATRARPELRFACAYRVSSHDDGRKYALLIFDVAGEIFTRATVRDQTPFMGIADALIFVADGSEIDVKPGRQPGDPGFTAVLSQIDHIRGVAGRPFLPMVAALVVAKSDTLRVFPEVDRWITRKDDMDLATVEQESEDVFAFLGRRQAGSWLAPVRKFQDVTLHFASATGGNAHDGEYAEASYQRQRVLRPLLSLLAMHGVIPRALLGTAGDAS